MSRTLKEIQDQLNLAQANEPELTTLNSPSQTAIYTLWKYVTSLGQYFLEFLVGTKQTEIETTLSMGIVPSDAWLQNQVLLFQYSATNPQVTTLVNFVPTYAVVDPSLRIITRASVKTLGNKIVQVKVAKDEPPVALSVGELAALNGYLTQGGDGTVAGAGTGKGYAGVQIIASSTTSDKLFIKGTITYNGQFASTIQVDVIAAINAYLAAIPFDGVVKVISLVDAIQAINNYQSVKDVLIEDLAIRANGTAFGSKTYIIKSSTTLTTTYPTFAGYVVEENTGGQTFTDQLTFVAG